MYKTTIIVLLLAALGFALPTSSPWDHQGAELNQSVTIIPGTSPIEYSTAFTREREMFGYEPRFLPLPVFFDKNNRPYILAEVPPGNTIGSNSFFTRGSDETENAYLQTIDDNGNWVVYSLEDMMRDIYSLTQYADPLVRGGYKWENRVVFDDENNINFTMITEMPDVSGTVLFYADQNRENWQTLHMNYVYNTSNEVFDTFSSAESALPTFANAQNDDFGVRMLWLTSLAKDPFGNYALSDMVNIVGAEGKFGPGHSGYLNYSLTVGNRVHFFWLDQLNQAPGEETKQYHNYYDKRTGYVSTPTFLGSTVGTWYGDPPSVPVDPHNGPSATVDRNKTLHVVLGGHGTQAKYTYSTDNGETWATAIDLPGGNTKNTYPTLITDRENTVHMTYRATLASGNYQLAYARKKAGQAWEDMGALVVPGNDGYSVYYHTMTVDRLGRVFLQYYYLADTMSESDKTEYRTKWPSLPDPDVEIYAHDPVIIMTDNGGDSWKIATTADFVGGVIDDTVPVAVYNFDSANIGLDMAAFDNNFNSFGSPASVSGIYGDAVSFDGTADGLRAEVSQADTFADGSFTVVGWFKPDATVSGLSNLVNAKTGTNGFALSLNNGQWIGYTYADGYTHSVVASAATTAGQWKHIAFTYKADGEADSTGTYTGTSKLYVDGSLVATQTARKYSPQDAVKVAVAMDTTQANFFACSVDELGIFTGAMPEQKIVELADNTFRPQNVSRELLYQGDINGDGFVDSSDLAIFAGSWLNAAN